MSSDVLPMFGLRIEVSPGLAGFKYAVQFGDGPVFVSPVMFDLIRAADEKELRVLLENIHIKHLPPMPDLSRLAVPMLTRPPSWEDCP